MAREEEAEKEETGEEEEEDKEEEGRGERCQPVTFVPFWWTGADFTVDIFVRFSTIHHRSNKSTKQKLKVKRKHRTKAKMQLTIKKNEHKDQIIAANITATIAMMEQKRKLKAETKYKL